MPSARLCKTSNRSAECIAFHEFLAALACSNVGTQKIGGHADGTRYPKRRASAGRPPHPESNRRRGHARSLPRRPRSDGRRNGAAAHRHRPPRQRHLHVGVHGVSSDRHDQRSDLRQDLRPLRPAARAVVRRGGVPGGVAALRPVARDAAARRVTRAPGARRGSAVPDRACGHRRHVRPVGARQVPGPGRSRIRPQLAHRSGHRRGRSFSLSSGARCPRSGRARPRRVSTT